MANSRPDPDTLRLVAGWLVKVAYLLDGPDAKDANEVTALTADQLIAFSNFLNERAEEIDVVVNDGVH